MYVATEIGMNRKHHELIWRLIIALSLVCSYTICFAQEPSSKTEAEIRALLKKSLAKKYKVADEANEVLSKLSVRDVPVLTAILRKGETCERMKAARLIVDLDRGNRSLTPALIELSKGGTESSSEDDLLCRRGATFLLALSAEGIRELTKFLRTGENLFIRRSAIFAFDELTETSNYPEGDLEVLKEAIPVIAESRKMDDEVLQNMSDEVLWQIVRGDNEDLSEIAKKYVEDSPD